MAGNLFDNPTLSIMYEDALQSLYNGCIMPWERDLLAEAPLPADMVDPFASEDVKPLSVMNLTYVSLSGWIADAKKEKYYSERFVQLSKLVMKGISTMARGLMTLHQRGEELSAAPMQIDDLISVGSYHFRKSYLGVVQFSAKHPEIGERLLVNQLGWATTLMRLYKTKEKLTEAHGGLSPAAAKPAQVTVPGVASLPKNEEGSIQYEELPDGKADNSSFFIHNSSLNNDSSLEEGSSFIPLHSSLDDAAEMEALEPFGSTDDGLDPLPALSAPGSYGALQAYKPLNKNQAGNKKSEIRNKKSDGLENEEVRMKNEEKTGTVTGDSELNRKGLSRNDTENEEVRMKNEETQSNVECGMRNSELPEISESKTLENEEVRMKKEELPDEEDNDSSFLLHNSSLDDDSSFLPHNSSLDEESELDDPPPDYYRILYEVFCRSSGNEDGSIDITPDEIHRLLADPEFCMHETSLAADLRRALESMPDPPED